MNKFTWVKTHKEIAQYLTGIQDRQEELVELLEECGVTGLHDEKVEGKRIKLQDMDPFSFFCFIHKYGDDRRLKILQDIASRFDLTVPEDVYGIPSTNPMMVMMFYYTRNRNEGDIENLWELFRQALNNDINENLFEQVLSQPGVGKTKITEALFYVDPETYLPINGPTKPYLKEVLDLDPSYSTWQEYLALLEEVRKKVDMPFYELSYEAYIWNVDKKANEADSSDTNYWLFQGNPKVFDLKGALKDDALKSWQVNAHKNSIQMGDKVILWMSGSKRGVYALCEVESEVHHSPPPEEEMSYYVDGSMTEIDSYEQVDLSKICNLTDDPITYDQIKNDPELTNLNIGNQGTNFTATKAEFEALLRTAKVKLDDNKYWLYAPGPNAKFWDEFYNKGIMAIGWEDLGNLNQYDSKEAIVTALQEMFDTDSSKKNDATANWEFAQEIKVGDAVIVKKGRDKYLGYGIVSSDYYYDESRDYFNSSRKVNWVSKGIWEEPEGGNVIKTLTDITPYPDYVARIKHLMGVDEIVTPKIELDYPLNTIFYGPPGTGKTYNTIKRAAEIVEGRKFENYKSAKEAFHNHLHEEIEFITFHQNYSYEDFIQGLRPDTENDKELTFDRVDGLFKELADKALKNYEASKRPQTKKRSFEDVFNIFIDPLVQGEVEEIEVEMKRVSYYITAVTNRSIEFRKASGVSSHTLSISTLRRMYEAEDVLEIQGLSSYYSPLLDKLLDMGKSPGETETVERKNYVLIIDEINRANISRVFGELITLIEPDKRYGRDMHIPAKLSSGENFSVPENLYIIGTMNTADKSIALLDIALRRRFEFEAMYPKYKIAEQTIHDVDVLKKINEQIIELKGHDFQIGHSYFMKNDMTLKQRMNRRVIPLLLEYFMNDEEEVRKILNKADLKIKEGEDIWPLEITGRA